MATTAKTKSAQDFVAIKEIHDGVVILEDNTMRMVLMASSLNFALKSADEQEAIIAQYQDFLNSLDFSLQFFIESKYLDIRPYLDSLIEAEKKQVNELLKIQIREYVAFVEDFVNLTRIVSKNFYIVIPFNPPFFGDRAGPAGLFSKFFGKNKGLASIERSGQKKTEDGKFDEYKSQLEQRVDAVIQGLARTGVRVVPLNTEELIELFYKLYNPGEAYQSSIGQKNA